MKDTVCDLCKHLIKQGSTYCLWNGAPVHPVCFLEARKSGEVSDG